MVISESSVRSDLHFNDEDGITCLSNVEIFENLALIGYERVSTKLTFQKAFFSHQWKYLIHTILHCLSSKSTAWNEFSTNLASAVICLAKEVNTSGSGEDNMEHHDDLTDFVPPTPHDSPLSGEELNLSDKGSGETEVFTTTEKDVNAAKPVSTAGDAVNAASVIFDVSVVGPSTSVVGPSTMIHDVKEEPMRATLPPTIQSQDKDLIVERKRFFAAQRAKQIRSNLPTKAQLRKKMITYLKHMGKYTHNQLKSKSFKEIKMLYEREHKWINDFVPMDSEEVNDSKQQGKSSNKRSRADHGKESVKKQKLEEDDAKKEELRACLDIVPVDDIAINVESLATKYPIVN
nr:hypothetical protein [Tanacetum cinerariifolium]